MHGIKKLSKAFDNTVRDISSGRSLHTDGNDRLFDINGREIDHLRTILSGYGPFIGIQNIRSNKILCVTFSTLFDKYDKT